MTPTAISDRGTFRALRAQGRRVRRGPITVSWLDDGSWPPRLAFGITRRVGSAVQRNRLRRRLRAILAEAVRGERPPTGSYLLTVAPPAVSLDHRQLRDHVMGALDVLHGGVRR